MKRRMCKVYIDGACSINSKDGAWAYVIIHNNCIIKKCGSKRNTTNNSMELEALRMALLDCENLGVREVTVYSDSAYVVNNIIDGSMELWKRNNWRTRKRKNIKNKNTWIKLYTILKKKDMRVKLVKVKAHSGDRYNDMVDILAKGAIKDSNVYSGENS